MTIIINTPLFSDVDWAPVIRLIEEADSIMLTTHRNPDGDGIGAQLALYDMLVSMGKSVRMFNRDGIPRIYRFLENSRNIECGQPENGHKYDLIVALDSASKGRLNLPNSFFEESALINIDHHASNTLYGDINVVDSRYCATGAMIFDLMIAIHMPLTAVRASAIYTAILTDTSSFRLASASAAVYRTAADLIDAGAKPWPTSVNVYESRPLTGFRLLSACLETLEIHDEGRSAWLYINRDMYDATGADVEDTEGLIDYGRSIGGVEIAVLIRCDESSESRWKVSFRGKSIVDVSALASLLGGGGHHYAAGCMMQGSFSEVCETVRGAVSAALK